MNAALQLHESLSTVFVLYSDQICGFYDLATQEICEFVYISIKPLIPLLFVFQ